MTRAISFGVVGLVALLFVASAGAAIEVCGKGHTSSVFSAKPSWKNQCNTPFSRSLDKVPSLVGRLEACRFDGKTSTFTARNGAGVILFDVHPSGYIEYFVPIGRQANGDVTKRISTPPHALKAVLETFSSANTNRYAKDLFIAYPEGVVQLSLNSDKPITNASMSGAIRAVTAGYSFCIAK